MLDDDLWDDLLGHLKQGVLLPVVGPELSTVAAPDGRRVTVTRLIGERLADRYKLAIDWPAHASLDPAIRAYIAAHGREKADRLYRLVNDALAELPAGTPPGLEALARITDFNLFVSTTFDPLLARALDATRFGGTPRTRQYAFSPYQSTVEHLKSARAPDRGEAVVFKLFGEASSTPQYALHEEDILEWLHALVSETAELPDWLDHRLKASPLLFLGCDTAEWVGRFLVRLGSSGRLSLSSKQFFLVGAGLSRQRDLVEFFATYCGSTRVQIVDADPALFIDALLEKWTARQPPAVADGAPAAQAAPAPGTIFISYVREDIDAARQIAGAIAKLGGDVWLDEQRLEAGDRWADAILTSIRREIRLFIPLVSKHTEARDEGYVFKEWGEAVARAKGIPRRRFIVPVTIDAEYSGNPTAYRQVPQDFLEYHFGRAPDGVPDADLVAALTDEIRAMRRRDAA